MPCHPHFETGQQEAVIAWNAPAAYLPEAHSERSPETGKRSICKLIRTPRPITRIEPPTEGRLQLRLLLGRAARDKVASR